MKSAHSKLHTAFQEACDPAAYVPRPATEAALEGLTDWLTPPAPGPAIAIVFGPAGIGKTCLLRVLEARRPKARDASPTALYLPYAGITPEDLCAWAYGSLGRSGELHRPVDATSAFEGLTALPGPGDAPFLLLVDDADSMPPALLEMLLREDLGARPAHRLRIVLALNDDARGSRLLGALQTLEPLEITLRDRLSVEETGEYLRGRMRSAGCSEHELRQVGPEEIGRVHALSSGLPLRIQRIAPEILADERDMLPGALDAKRRREAWMGRPIEDEDDDGLVD